jgi:hypothetical protein
MRKRCFSSALVLLAILPGVACAEPPWDQGFQNPPPDCRPEVFWDWMGGQLSKEGISKDLEALAREGVGGVMIMQMPDQLAGTTQWRLRDYPGKVKCLSDEWFAIMNHTAKETDRLGLRMSFVMSPGWSHCGGPWIKPEQSLKVLVASRTPVTGGRRFDAVLPRAPIHQPKVSDETLAGNAEADFWDRVRNPHDDFYRDVAVVALPAAANGKLGAVQHGLRGGAFVSSFDHSPKLHWGSPSPPHGCKADRPTPCCGEAEQRVNLSSGVDLPRFSVPGVMRVLVG